MYHNRDYHEYGFQNGPANDHSGPDRNRDFLYCDVDAAWGPRKFARLEAGSFPKGRKCFRFWYNMYGADIGELRVTGAGNKVLWSQWEDTKQLLSWREARVVYDEAWSFPIGIEGSAGKTKDNSQQSFLYIDDLSLSNEATECQGWFDCNFDGPQESWLTGCGWQQNDTDLTDWKRGYGESMYSNRFTGPLGDHTTGRGYYAHFVARPSHKPGADARITSPPIPQGRHCLQFAYNMFGADMGALRLYMRPKQSLRDPALGDKMPEYSEVELWRKDGDQGNRWLMEHIQLDFDYSQQVTFQAIRGDGVYGDIGIDDVLLLRGDCPHIHGYDCTFDNEHTCDWVQETGDKADFEVTKGQGGGLMTFWRSDIYGHDSLDTSIGERLAKARSRENCERLCLEDSRCVRVTQALLLDNCWIHYAVGTNTQNHVVNEHRGNKIKSGPSGDFTGLYGGGGYLMFDAAKTEPDDDAKITSPLVPAGDYCFSFAFNLRCETTKCSEITVTKNDKVMKVVKERGMDSWRKFYLTISELSEFRLSVTLKRGWDYGAHAALDDLKIRPGACSGDVVVKPVEEGMDITYLTNAKPETVITNKKLVSHAIGDVLVVASVADCMARCRAEPLCRSVNIEVTPKNCQLNNELAELDPFNYVAATGFNYGTNVSPFELAKLKKENICEMSPRLAEYLGTDCVASSLYSDFYSCQLKRCATDSDGKYTCNSANPRSCSLPFDCHALNAVGIMQPLKEAVIQPTKDGPPISTTCQIASNKVITYYIYRRGGAWRFHNRIHSEHVAGFGSGDREVMVGLENMRRITQDIDSGYVLSYAEVGASVTHVFGSVAWLVTKVGDDYKVGGHTWWAMDRDPSDRAATFGNTGYFTAGIHSQMLGDYRPGVIGKGVMGMYHNQVGDDILGLGCHRV